MAPKLRRIVTFYSSDNPASQRSLEIAREAAQALELEIDARPVASRDELRTSIRALQALPTDALFFMQ